ncbi:MAG TPA: DUF1559 domain-containing protein [Pirellulales bacterium]|nr:DUF1559 domain-containing protein [Pirellulales bacterium]
MQPAPARGGFSLIELLVVVGIIGLLVAVLLPAIQSSRESARRSQCLSNLKQIGLALGNYADQQGCLPPASTSSVDAGVWDYATKPAVSLHSFASLVLTHLEESSLRGQINFGVSALDPVNRAAAATVLSIYRCPSFDGGDFSGEPKYTAIAPRFAIRNYVALGATTIGTLWAPGPDGQRHPDGAIYCQSSTRLKDILDGLSHTVLVAETREQDAAVWIDGTGAAAVGRPFDVNNVPAYAMSQCVLNYQPYFIWGDSNDSIDSQYGPSSMHAGRVVGHVYAGGSAKFISDEIDPAVYDALISRAGGEVLDQLP